MLPAWFSRLLTFNNQGQPEQYALSDQMRADLSVLFQNAGKMPSQPWRERLWAFVEKRPGGCENIDQLKTDLSALLQWLDETF